MNKVNLAFPLVDENGIHDTGMTLRDYFAIHSKYEEWSRFMPCNDNGDIVWRRDMISEAKYMFADSMLKAREK